MSRRIAWARKAAVNQSDSDSLVAEGVLALVTAIADELGVKRYERAGHLRSEPEREAG